MERKLRIGLANQAISGEESSLIKEGKSLYLEVPCPRLRPSGEQLFSKGAEAMVKTNNLGKFSQPPLVQPRMTNSPLSGKLSESRLERGVVNQRFSDTDI